VTTERNSYTRRRIRARLLAQLRDGDPCARCGGAMFRALARYLDVGHVTAVVLGGTFADGARLEHRRCSRSAGARLGNTLRRQGPVMVAWQRAARRW